MPDCSPVAVYEVPVTVAGVPPSREISYPATDPESSVEALHRTVREEPVAEPTVTPDGALGGVVSVPEPPAQGPPLSLQPVGVPVPLDTQPKDVDAPGANGHLRPQHVEQAHRVPATGEQDDDHGRAAAR